MHLSRLRNETIIFLKIRWPTCQILGNMLKRERFKRLFFICFRFPIAAYRYFLTGPPSPNNSFASSLSTRATAAAQRLRCRFVIPLKRFLNIWRSSFRASTVCRRRKTSTLAARDSQNKTRRRDVYEHSF